MAKRIGIITIQKCNNYGADLQAYALGAKLRLMGYDAENIDYLFYKHPRHQGGRMEKPVLPISFKNHIKEFLFPIVSSVRDFWARRNRKERRRRFDAWFKANVKVGREYRSVKSLYDDPPRYDVYMVGSDQVWNPRLYSNIEPYFLDFVSEGAKCVSYASSFGVSELSGLAFYRYKQWLKKFSFIGLREKNGADIVKAMALDAEVEHVLDPTLLLKAEEWAQVAVEPEERPTGKYLLLYDLITSQETVDLAKRWSGQNGWQVVRVGDGTYGPGEFVWLFAHAEAVVTNSFHGTAFAILNGKAFYSVVPKTMTNSARIKSLLNSLQIQSRLVSYGDVSGIEFENEVDFESVKVKLEELRNKSEAFLIGSIDGEKRSLLKPREIFAKPRSCYAVWNGDAGVRSTSTSGGVFTLLAEDVISRGGIVYGARWSADFKSVHHAAAMTNFELGGLRQSKYVESDASAAIRGAKIALAEGREVLFSGTPCQCMAMRTAAKGMEEKLLLVDFVCHGTPMAEVWKSYAEQLEKENGSKLVRYEFRNKDKGWNFQNIVYEFTRGKKSRVLPWLDPYFHGFSINVFLKNGCYTCPFAQLMRISDFTIGDCWRVATCNPEYDDNKGTSLVLVNSDKAEAIWRKVMATRKVLGGEYDIDQAQCRNMALMHPPVKPDCRDAFLKEFQSSGSFKDASMHYLSWRKAMKYALMYWVKRMGWFYFKHHQ